MLTINTTNIINNEIFQEFVNEYIYKRYIGQTITPSLIASINSLINKNFEYYIEVLINSQIYIFNNNLIITLDNPYLKELDLSNYNVYSYDILKFNLSEEELFYFKLKYNVIDGCCDITNKDFRIEIINEEYNIRA